MILHIPHSSKTIKEGYRDLYQLDDVDLQQELILMVDAYTDELYQSGKATRVLFEFPRLLVDVERFPDDKDEPMSKKGMGMIYSHTAFGLPLSSLINDYGFKMLVRDGTCT